MASEATQDRILDAALAAMETHGVSRVSVGDIAKRADLSRQTLYRYFRVKDELLAAVIERETDRIVSEIQEAAKDPDRPVDGLASALATAVRAAQAHAVLQRALETDREVLVSYLTGSPGVVEPTRPALARMLRSLLDEVDVDVDESERMADLAVRIIVSWILNPPPEDLDEAAAALARLLVQGLDPTVDLRHETDVRSN